MIGIMNEDYTHLAIVIDRSGSMSGQWKAVEGGYREIIQENKDAEGKCTVTTAAFDNQYDLLEDGTNIKNASLELPVYPRSMTALYDAVGRTIEHTRRYISKMPKKRRPAKVLFMIQTDGYENASREYNRQQIVDMIEEFQREHNWQFMFLGAEIGAVNEAKSWGIKNSVLYSESKTDQSLDLVKRKMVETRNCSLDMVAATYSISAQEAEEIQ